MGNEKGEVLIEAVIYTLIALSIIGIALGIIKPAIDERKDAIAVRQSVDILNVIDEKINEVKYVAGNARSMQVKVSRGQLIVDGAKDKIRILIENSRYALSEPGLNVTEGNIIEYTEANGKRYTITLTLDYSAKLNITYKGKDVQGILQYASAPYNIIVKNNGGSPVNIDFS